MNGKRVCVWLHSHKPLFRLLFYAFFYRVYGKCILCHGSVLYTADVNVPYLHRSHGSLYLFEGLLPRASIVLSDQQSRTATWNSSCPFDRTPWELWQCKELAVVLLLSARWTLSKSVIANAQGTFRVSDIEESRENESLVYHWWTSASLLYRR
jgi:hypothetical protein